MGSEWLAWCVEGSKDGCKEGSGASVVLEVAGGLRGRKLAGSTYTLVTSRCGLDTDLWMLWCSGNITQETGAEALAEVILSRGWTYTHSDALIKSAGWAYKLSSEFLRVFDLILRLFSKIVGMEVISGILGRGEQGSLLGNVATPSGCWKTVWMPGVEDVWCLMAFSMRPNTTLACPVSNVKVPGPESHRLPASMVKASCRSQHRAKTSEEYVTISSFVIHSFLLFPLSFFLISQY